MQGFIIVATVIAVIVAYSIYSTFHGRRKRVDKLRRCFGKIPTQKYDETDMESIACYWQERSHAEKLPFAVDDTTWGDLDMDAVFARVNNTCSSVGEEYLYGALHETQFNGEKLAQREQLIRYLDAHDEERLRLQTSLDRLGKVGFNGLCGFLYHPVDKRLDHFYLYPLLAAAALISIAATVFRPAAGALFLLVMLAVNIFVYYRKKPAIESQLITMRYISSLMLCVKRLLRLKTDGLKDYTARLAKLYAPLKKAGRAGTLLTGTGSDLDFLFEYFKLILMLDFIVYSRVLSLIEHRGAEFREAYAIIGQLDAAVSVVSYRRSLSYYCVPEFTGSESLELEEMYHPLLKKPVPNSVTLRRSVLVTGSNASGKSTFVKAVAVNAIFAQTIHTCLARSFRLKPSFVVTSMAVGDDIEAGESYYVAEVRSLRRMIARLSPETRCLCFIDEILRGTNTIERIAASAAILDYLRSRNCLVLAATHDIELTEITAAYFDNYHFREHVSGRGIRFDYKIHEGWATTKNAIRLLEFMEYDRSITSEASMLAEGFEKSRSWERLP